MQLADFLDAVKSRKSITVREIVQKLKPWFEKDSAKNKQQMKLLMKLCVDHNKESGIVTLKEEYLNTK